MNSVNRDERFMPAKPSIHPEVGVDWHWPTPGSIFRKDDQARKGLLPEWRMVTHTKQEECLQVKTEVQKNNGFK
jgi:hypothetical protein